MTRRTKNNALARSGFLAAMAAAAAAGLAVQFASAGASPEKDNPQRPLLITADLLFDGTRFLTGQAVLVRDGKIVQVAPAGTLQAHGARRIEVPGGTILPGFIDMHTHHIVNKVPPLRILQHGVTTARDLGGPLTPVLINAPFQLRQLLSGPIITAKGGYPIPVFPGSGVEVAGPGEARAKVRELAAQGASVIAISLEPGGEAGAPWTLHHASSPPPWPTLSKAELDAIVNEAHLLGKRVVAYLGTPEGAQRALDAGIGEWAHMPCDPLPDSLIQYAGSRKLAIDGTLDTLVLCTGAQHNAGKLVAAGAKLFYSTDMAHPDIPHGIDAQEIHRQLHAGKTVDQALASATSEAGRYLGLAPLGQLVPGAPADIIVTGADPRQNFKELEYPRLVVAGGKVVIERDKGE
ncbi:MAG: amidohydrolase family protein [Beijerinckiaceae bacterium]|nr:amidohydrolase family protein [Beijerinckiaceae bacterium]